MLEHRIYQGFHYKFPLRWLAEMFNGHWRTCHRSFSRRHVSFQLSFFPVSHPLAASIFVAAFHVPAETALCAIQRRIKKTERGGTSDREDLLLITFLCWPICLPPPLSPSSPNLPPLFFSPQRPVQAKCMRTFEQSRYDTKMRFIAWNCQALWHSRLTAKDIESIEQRIVQEICITTVICQDTCQPNFITHKRVKMAPVGHVFHPGRTLNVI